MRLCLGSMAVLALAAVLAVGCGEDEPAPVSGETLTVWNHESQPDRLEATQAILEAFTRSTGIKTDQLPVPEDGLPRMIRRAHADGELPDVVLSTGMPHAHRYAAEGVFDAAAAQEVIDRLGRETFSKRAIALVSSDGRAAGVPSDGWGQLLIYRKDLFDQAGLQAPQTLADVVAAARELDRDGRAGIALATAPRDGFTAETFEHIALAQGCQLVDAAADVIFDSPECVEALRLYAELAQRYSLERRPGRGLHARRLLLGARGDAVLVAVPARRAGGPERREPAHVHGVQAGSGLSGPEQRSRRPAGRVDRRAEPVRLGGDLQHHRRRTHGGRPAARRVPDERRLRALAGALAAGQVPGSRG